MNDVGIFKLFSLVLSHHYRIIHVHTSSSTFFCHRPSCHRDRPLGCLAASLKASASVPTFPQPGSSCPASRQTRPTSSHTPNVRHQTLSYPIPQSSHPSTPSERYIDDDSLHHLTEVQLQRALSTAATVTSQIIHLHHFIPLQIMLLGSYSRLFAVSSHVLATFESSVEGRSPRPIGSHDVLDPKASADLIQSDRPIIVKSSPVTAGRQGRDLTNDTQMDLAVKRQLPPSDTASEEERLSKKRKGRSVMDDIFG